MINEIKISDYPDMDWESLFEDAEMVQEEYNRNSMFLNEFIVKIDNEKHPELNGVWITDNCDYWWSEIDSENICNKPPSVIYRAEEREVKTKDWFRKI